MRRDQTPKQHPHAVSLFPLSFSFSLPFFLFSLSLFLAFLFHPTKIGSKRGNEQHCIARQLVKATQALPCSLSLCSALYNYLNSQGLEEETSSSKKHRELHLKTETNIWSRFRWPAPPGSIGFHPKRCSKPPPKAGRKHLRPPRTTSPPAFKSTQTPTNHKTHCSQILTTSAPNHHWPSETPQNPLQPNPSSSRTTKSSRLHRRPNRDNHHRRPKNPPTGPPPQPEHHTSEAQTKPSHVCLSNTWILLSKKEGKRQCICFRWGGVLGSRVIWPNKENRGKGWPKDIKVFGLVKKTNKRRSWLGPAGQPRRKKKRKRIRRKEEENFLAF